ncbi:MAG: hypothetical protein V1928_04220 [Parcubacteria group bacterium]
MEPLQVMTLKKLKEIRYMQQDKHDLICGLIILCALIGVIVFGILSTGSGYFMIGTGICSIAVILSVRSAIIYEKKFPTPGNAVAALNQNLSKLFNPSDGGVKYVADIAYNLLSKWIKEEHCSSDHPHLSSTITDLRINLSLWVLHFPEIIPLNNENLPAGEFKFNNVRNQGPASLEWKLQENGLFSLKLIHKESFMNIP